MEKIIVIKEHEDGHVSVDAKKGVRWTTLIVGIELMLECILNDSGLDMSLDDVLADVRRIYLRDNNGK